MTVPMTVKRERVEASTVCVGIPVGRGMYDKANRKRTLGTRYRARLGERIC